MIRRFDGSPWKCTPEQGGPVVHTGAAPNVSSALGTPFTVLPKNKLLEFGVILSTLRAPDDAPACGRACAGAPPPMPPAAELFAKMLL